MVLEKYLLTNIYINACMLIFPHKIVLWYNDKWQEKLTTISGWEVYYNSVALIFKHIGICIFLKFLENFKLFVVYFYVTRDQTQDLMHTKQVLYH